MHIDMFMPGLRGDSLGAQVHEDFAAAVRASGHAFRIVTTGASSPAGWLHLPLSRTWRALDSAAAPWTRTTSLLSPAAALAGHLRRYGSGIDVLHEEVAYPFGTSAALAVAAAGWRGLLAVTPMGEDTLVHDPSAYGFRRHAVPRYLVARTLRGAGAIRCISPMHERAVVSIAPDVPRRVIPLNVSASVVALAGERAGARAQRRRDARVSLEARYRTTGRPLVVSLGRLHPFKGIDVLIAAMRRVPDAMLVIAGPSLTLKATGDEAARLRALVERWGLRDRVHLAGPVSPAEAPTLLAGADVLAVPSHIESLNKVCVEAAAVGTPFVVTATTGISAWVGPSSVGLVVPPGDADTMAQAICTALARTPPDPSDIEAFVAPFAPDRVARELCTFYEEVLAERR